MKTQLSSTHKHKSRNRKISQVGDSDVGAFVGNHAQDVGRDFDNFRVRRRTVQYPTNNLHTAFSDELSAVTISWHKTKPGLFAAFF